ncbi:hypothetical protein V494_06133 [Pseudogymnoascus sp. VKM F-4513 (FW-928)]|nr:hypothetical protein V494_06133 [Pseudogymnoascus sp. VKM F-4513 (FW-928)]
MISITKSSSTPQEGIGESPDLGVEIESGAPLIASTGDGMGQVCPYSGVEVQDPLLEPDRYWRVVWQHSIDRFTSADASKTGIGACLFQIPNFPPGTNAKEVAPEDRKVVMFNSAKLSGPQSRGLSETRLSIAELQRKWEKTEEESGDDNDTGEEQEHRKSTK